MFEERGMSHYFIMAENGEQATKKRRIGSKFVMTFLILCLISTFSFPSLMKDEVVNSEVANKQKKEIELPQTSSNSINEKVVYLTFDDGPTIATDDILDMLQEHQANATFFMLSPQMEERPDLVKRIVEDGHAVGLHAVTHDINHFYQSQQTALAEMNQTQEVLKKITGIESTLIRTPYGSVPYLTDPFRKVLKEAGYELWDWNIDSRDWELPEGKYVENVVSSMESMEKDSVTPLVVLLHDQAKTAKYLPQLLTYLTTNGYQMKKFDASVAPMQFKCYDRCYRLDIP